MPACFLILCTATGRHAAGTTLKNAEEPGWYGSCLLFSVSHFFSLGERPGQDVINCSGVLSMTPSRKTAPGSWAETLSTKTARERRGEGLFVFSFY